MKLVSFRRKDEKGYGILIENEKILPLNALSSFIQCSIPKTLEELISTGWQVIEKVENALKVIGKEGLEEFLYDERDADILPPITSPPKIICLGLNYYDHVDEQPGKVPIPEEPIIFMKPRTTIIGPNQPIIKPSFVKQLDYEAELAVIIGKRGKNIPMERAQEHIFGYTILNDVSARDIQFKDKQWTRGKSFDTFAPIGPCVTLRNQIEDSNNLRIRTWVNNELRQGSSTKNMIFSVREIIYHLSKVMTLEPCDIIATGTPAGVGAFMKPEPSFLETGDKVTIEIEGIGKLQNTVTKASL